MAANEQASVILRDIYGITDKSKDGQTSAKKHYSDFCEALGQPRDFDAVAEEFATNVANFKKFGSWLIDHALTHTAKKTSLMRNTVLNYMSAMFSVISTKYGSADFKYLGKNMPPEWYSLARYAVGKELVLKCIREGTPVSEKSESIGRVRLGIINGHLLEQGCAKAIQHMFEFSMAFHAVGRAGEAALTNVQSAKWDIINGGNLVLDWNQKKNAKQAPINFFNDWSDYRICWYFSLYCYLLVGQSKGTPEINDSESWLFPHLKTYKSDEGASQYITRSLQAVVASDELLHDFDPESDWDATSIRSGAAETLATRLPQDSFYSAMRSGHHEQMAKDCRLYEYTPCRASTVAVGEELQKMNLFYEYSHCTSLLLCRRSSSGRCARHVFDLLHSSIML